MLPFMEEHLSRTPRAATLLGSHTLSQLLQMQLLQIETGWLHMPARRFGDPAWQRLCLLLPGNRHWRDFIVTLVTDRPVRARESARLGFELGSHLAIPTLDDRDRSLLH
jgi:hypothetical protein